MRTDAQRLTTCWRRRRRSSRTSHFAPGTLADGLVFDAVRVRLIEIGEAVKDVDPDLLAIEPDSRGLTLHACGTTWRTATSTPTTRL